MTKQFVAVMIKKSHFEKEYQNQKRKTTSKDVARHGRKKEKHYVVQW